MAIEDWMPNLAERMAAVSGIEAVYFPHGTDADAGLPGTLQVFPSIIILPVRGSQIYSAGGPNIAIHRVVMTLYAVKTILNEGYAIAIPFIKLVRNKLAGDLDIGLPNQVDHVLPDTQQGEFYEGPGAIKYGSAEHLGIKFYIEVKEHEAITVAA